MNKSDLIETLSKDTGLPIRKAEEVVKTVFNSMATALTNNDRVEIRGLGLLRSNTMMDAPAETLRQAKKCILRLVRYQSFQRVRH